MKRLALLAAAVLALGAAPAHAVTNTYSTGDVSLPIGATFAKSLTVQNRGPLSFIRVSFRITAPQASSLAISLVSPKGTEVPLVTHRGAGADFGSDTKDCGGIQTVVDSDTTTNPIAEGSAPFTENPYRAEGDLRALYGENTKGAWTLKVANSGQPARLNCLTLDLSRRIPQTYAARKGNVRASVSFTERNYLFEELHLKVARGGKQVVDAPLTRLNCPDCRNNRVVGIKVVDLDGGEPEVIVDMYTGGAHCCMVTLILRWDGTHYRPKLAYWGNYGSRLADLDGDRLPEWTASDERFIYEYTAYVFSSAPIQISQYRAGRFVDVTRRFPALIRKNAAKNWRYYLQGRGGKDTDVRSYVAAYVADQYLLGKPAEAKRALDLALKRGDLGRGKSLLGTPAGTAFVALLNRDLRKWGYIR